MHACMHAQFTCTPVLHCLCWARLIEHNRLPLLSCRVLAEPSTSEASATATDMQLTVAAWDDRVFPVKLDFNTTLGALQAILEAEPNTPAAQQQLMHYGKPLPASAAGQTLSALGIANGDVLMLLQQGPAAAAQPQPQQQQQQQQQQPQNNPHMALAEDGSARAPAAFIQAFKDQPGLLAQLPDELASAVRKENVQELQVRLGLAPRPDVPALGISNAADKAALLQPLVAVCRCSQGITACSCCLPSCVPCFESVESVAAASGGANDVRNSGDAQDCRGFTGLPPICVEAYPPGYNLAPATSTSHGTESQ